MVTQYPVLRDGLWAVITPTICAAFEVRDGKVDMNECAPILRKRIDYWVTVARFICP